MRARHGLVILPILLIVSCATAVPRVSPELIAAARARDPDASGEGLERGRDLFTTRCDTCHSLPPPTSHSASEWPGFVASMGKKARLDQVQQDEILRYVLAARSLR